jgi:hypothetical protein
VLTTDVTPRDQGEGTKKVDGVRIDIFVGLAKEYLKAEVKKRLDSDL